MQLNPPSSGTHVPPSPHAPRSLLHPSVTAPHPLSEPSCSRKPSKSSSCPLMVTFRMQPENPSLKGLKLNGIPPIHRGRPRSKKLQRKIACSDIMDNNRQNQQGDCGGVSTRGRVGAGYQRSKSYLLLPGVTAEAMH